MRGVGGGGNWWWSGGEEVAAEGVGGGGRNKTPVFEPLFPISKVEQSHIC